MKISNLRLNTDPPHKVLCVVGPTATGKTGLAINLNKKFKGVLISADSRQVYRGMDLVTGKDHPKKIKLAGIDLVNPNEVCSVSLWYRAICPLLSFEKLPIVVGGTGLYIKSLTEGIPTIFIPPNPSLRKKLEQESILSLQTRLQLLNSARSSRLNQSDSLNPRRLIRAIEIEEFALLNEVNSLALSIPQNPNSLLIGLQPPDPTVYRRLITNRVLVRLNKGALQETKDLVTKYGKNLPSLTAIGYRSLIAHLEKKITVEKMISNWVADEYSYAKRQLTWFKKVAAINWFSVEDPLLYNKVVNLVEKFAHSCYDK